MAIEEDGMGAQTRRGTQRHRGMNAELACFVAGGGDHTALIGPAANDNGLPSEFRALQKLHGDEESVHVHVENGGVKGEFPLFGGIVFGAESSEIRHRSRV